jgi:ribosomal subunit interface protein
MRYQISGKQINIGDALQTHVKDSLGAVMEKYAQRPTDAMVIFSKSGAEFICEATVHLSTGLTASAKAHSHEIYAAFERPPTRWKSSCAATNAASKTITAIGSSLLMFSARPRISSPRPTRKTKTLNRKHSNPSSWPKWRRRSLRSRSVKP